MYDEAKGRSGRPLWQETILLLGIALVLALLVKHFLVQAFYIPSESMEPQFYNHDRILVEKLSSWDGDHVRRGDIIVFKDPGGWLPPQPEPSLLVRAVELTGLYPSGGHLVKRVIGIGGDHVVCCDAQHRITVNGRALDESSYLPKDTLPSLDPFDVVVPAGKLWVMGDNRAHSGDSRYHSPGFVDQDLVVGRVWALFWPWKRMEVIHRPATFDHIPTPA